MHSIHVLLFLQPIMYNFDSFNCNPYLILYCMLTCAIWKNSISQSVDDTWCLFHIINEILSRKISAKCTNVQNSIKLAGSVRFLYVITKCFQSMTWTSWLNTSEMSLIYSHFPPAISKISVLIFISNINVRNKYWFILTFYNHTLIYK